MSLAGNPGNHTADPYPYSRIWVNGRYVILQNILEGMEPARTPFEESTFHFISSWLNGEEAFSMTTSGSTGTPKSITVHRDQMIKSALLTAEAIKLRKNSTALICIDPRYIGGKMMVVRSLIFGLKIMAVDPTSNPLIRIPIDKCVQFTAFVPYQIHSILESKHPHFLNNIDKILIGGAPLDAAAREKLDSFQCECYETYGMTETISHIALRLANTRMKQPYFEALPGVQLSQDSRGCLLVDAPHLGDTVVTNDIVDMIDSGRFLWIGRWDNVINTGGVKVMPEKIERLLDEIFQKHGSPFRFFIAALPDVRLGNKIVLIVEGVQFSSEILTSAFATLRTVLTPYEVPREVYSIPSFVSTETQKVDRIQTIAGIRFLSSF